MSQRSILVSNQGSQIAKEEARWCNKTRLLIESLHSTSRLLNWVRSKTRIAQQQILSSSTKCKSRIIFPLRPRNLVNYWAQIQLEAIQRDSSQLTLSRSLRCNSTSATVSSKLNLRSRCKCQCPISSYQPRRRTTNYPSNSTCQLSFKSTK